MKLVGLVAAIVVAAGIYSGAANAATIGIEHSPNSGCLSPGSLIFNTDGLFTFPTAGHVTSWSHFAAASPNGSVALVIIRPTGGGNYVVVYGSAAHTVVGSVLNTFSAPNVAVKAGDIIGLWFEGLNEGCTSAAGSATYLVFSAGSPPNAGDTIAAGSVISFSTGETNIAATYSTGGAKVAAIPQVNHIFLCYSKFESDPGVWDSDTAAKLLIEGYWIPYALAGNVDGATNLGDFHLACNLSGSQKPTGGFVDDGGDTWSADYASMAGLYPQAG